MRGSFEGGDKAKEIVHAKVDYNGKLNIILIGVLCLVIWKTRLNGFLP